MKNLTFRVGILSIIFSAGISLQAVAAPQILGLLASVEPTSLTCSGGVCAAEFSSFCLQQHRKTPDSGTAYVPSKQTRISISVTGPDGVTRRTSVSDQVRVSSLRGYTTVLIAFPENLVTKLGKGPATMTVAPGAALVPTELTGSTDLLVLREIALYTGPIRQAASATNQREAVNVQAARLMNQMVNDLPADRDLTQSQRDEAWARSIKNHSGKVSAPALDLAAKAFRNCRTDFNRYGLDGMRACMGHEHDRSMIDVTRKVWEDQKGGS